MDHQPQQKASRILETNPLSRLGSLVYIPLESVANQPRKFFLERGPLNSGRASGW